MAEERHVGLERANDSAADDDVDQTKAALQRRMEEARESITQTVSEIKDTVVNQYQQVKENISDTLDWREQYRRHTLPFTLTAFAVGAAVGYAVMGAFKGEGEEGEYEDDGAFDRIEQGFDRGVKGPARSYAAQPVLGRAAAGAYQRVTDEGEDVGPETRPSYSSGYQAPTAPQPQGLTSYAAPAAAAQEAEEEEPKGPGLIERFKETKAYDRLQEELSTLGERALEELSKTARNVVVPALLNKVKGLIGLDLSGQQQEQGGGQRRQVASTQTAQPAYAGGTGAGAAGASGPAGSAGSAGTSDASGTSARAAAGGTEGYGAS